MKLIYTLSLLIWMVPSVAVQGQHSVARQWNEVLLDAIRTDESRPTVHARNLFHTSVAMYDLWAAYDPVAEPYLLGKTVDGFDCPYDVIEIPNTAEARTAARREAISYALYRLLRHRFQNSPGAAAALASFDSLLAELGYDPGVSSEDYSNGSPAALGNYLAARLIEFGLQDGAHELADYADSGYAPVNPPCDPTLPGTQGIVDMNRWQPLRFESGTQTPFLNPHWGQVSCFSLTDEQLAIHQRNGHDYWIFLDPTAPPYLSETVGGLADDYKWAFALVAVWSSHLDPGNGVMIDISPASTGNVPILPETVDEMREFYDFYSGGVREFGYPVNPHTGEPYAPNLVPLGDFARVIAEFWADGPASETPPGHWFTLLNYVSDHPAVEKRYKGEGPVLDDLEWDVKCYFTLGAAVHDVAVAAWGSKSWYDYIRPISALRGMAEIGQSSDPDAPNFDPAGMPLVPGYIELVETGDPLAGENGEHIGKIKFYAWKGHGYIEDPDTDVAGVDWILAENWWPYQRPSFVTPPFAGYVSGHSAFSRAAAEVLTLLTGDEYFPGGMGEFRASKNEYLVFEEGPSVDVTLQWATYRDASDQASLSRLWGGIHPPVDDIPGRRMGQLIGPQVFYLAEQYFTGTLTATAGPAVQQRGVVLEPGTPNPFTQQTTIRYTLSQGRKIDLAVYDLLGRRVTTLVSGYQPAGEHRASWTGTGPAGAPLPSGLYLCRLTSPDGKVDLSQKVILRR